jgi:competence protein ComFB
MLAIGALQQYAMDSMAMRLHNYMEDVVEKVLNEVLCEAKGRCTCEQCQKDVASLVLNRLPPRYVANPKGIAFTEIDALNTKFRTDVVREIKKAMALVAESPKHIN